MVDKSSVYSEPYWWLWAKNAYTNMTSTNIVCVVKEIVAKDKQFLH